MTELTPPDEPSEKTSHQPPNALYAKACQMGCCVKTAFTDHPKAAGETYWQHLLFTLGMSARLFLAGIVILVHGLFPFLFIHTASSRLRKCHEVLDVRAQRTGGKPEDL